RSAERAQARPGSGQRASTPGPVVITGDLNVVEPGHVPHYRVFGTWEYDFYRAFAASGFVDVFPA
ncbi:hypothetical protein, partial [Nocardia otitidiscaviarum]|uniref:hypothetical protein n=1 Tax=Nocardia otitidiscaviarum TaxID=1823 RepID=UPI001E506A7C